MYKPEKNVELVGEDENIFGHEEADVSIISYLFLFIESSEAKHIQVRCDDTDILLLLMYFTWNFKPTVLISMRKFDDSVININASAQSLGHVCDELLAMHAFTGCDTTSYPFKKGKTSGLSILKKYSDLNLQYIGEQSTTRDEVIEIGTKFFAYLYGSKIPVKMNSLRHHIFITNKSTPPIHTLPPTDEALAQHLLRSHIQVMIWKSALDEMPPPPESITDWGWEIKDGIPIPVIGIDQVAPPDLLKTVACGCKSESPCSRHNCSCKSEGLSCTTFCKCHGEEVCQNPHTKCGDVDNDDEEEDDNDNELYE